MNLHKTVLAVILLVSGVACAMNNDSNDMGVDTSTNNSSSTDLITTSDSNTNR